MTATTTNEDAIRAAVAELPRLPWLAADFVAADVGFGHDFASVPEAEVVGRILTALAPTGA